MIDKITPRPAESVQELLKKDDFEDTGITITEKNTYIASFRRWKMQASYLQTGNELRKSNA